MYGFLIDYMFIILSGDSWQLAVRTYARDPGQQSETNSITNVKSNIMVVFVMLVILYPLIRACVRHGRIPELSVASFDGN